MVDQEPLFPAEVEAGDEEAAAAQPIPVDRAQFNPRVELPYGLQVDHIAASMESFTRFLGFINNQLVEQGIVRLESMLMPANFSSIVGEYMISNIPTYCPTLAKNNYHNGHPDLLPNGLYPGNAAQHVTEGIEVKGSRYISGWQGHNPEDCWLMVFVFDSSRPTDGSKGIAPKPFQFLAVLGAQLEMADWQFAGRSGASRRTITASVRPSGRAKMLANWIYKSPGSGL